ncbi:SDR family NAD(P)-dependent oxidoreductase [Micromonospora sp. NPDC049366]|uniref:SDR family NAD(P)-dependent oxidoreductase n=1 Tax=Micromonospora sp. NPDC049366 TaxID=3364271 RepID=UPI00378EBEF6
MRRFDFAGATALVTGAASGIGEALAHALARRGSHLVLLDRDAERLDAVVAAIRAAHPDRQLHTYVVDLADPAETARVAAEIRQRHPRLRLLVNNAGVALGGRFDQVTFEEFSWVVDINFRAVAQLTHALLPALKAEPGAHLVNVSSLFGLMAPPGQTAYAASKFAVRGFTEALRAELAEDGIGVTSVHPGGIKTRIAANARVGSGVEPTEYEQGRRQFEKLLTIPPARAAEVILRAVTRRRGRALIGWSAKLPDLLVRVAPAGYQRVIALGLRGTGTGTPRTTTPGPAPADAPLTAPTGSAPHHTPPPSPTGSRPAADHTPPTTAPTTTPPVAVPAPRPAPQPAAETARESA